VDNQQIQTRWKHALHESGHALCTFAYSGQPCAARLTAAGGNSDSLGHLPHPAQGIALAGGVEAELLAQRVAPPELTAVGEVLLAAQLAGARFDARRATTPPRYASPSDATLLGWWAVERNPDCPELWPASIAWARAQAAGFVSDNAGTIVALARRLFQQGKIDAEDFSALGLVAEQPSPQEPAELAQPRAEPARSVTRV